MKKIILIAIAVVVVAAIAAFVTITQSIFTDDTRI